MAIYSTWFCKRGVIMKQIAILLALLFFIQAQSFSAPNKSSWASKQEESRELKYLKKEAKKLGISFDIMDRNTGGGVTPGASAPFISEKTFAFIKKAVPIMLKAKPKNTRDIYIMLRLLERMNKALLKHLKEFRESLEKFGEDGFTTEHARYKDAIKKLCPSQDNCIANIDNHILMDALTMGLSLMEKKELRRKSELLITYQVLLNHSLEIQHLIMKLSKKSDTLLYDKIYSSVRKIEKSKDIMDYQKVFQVQYLINDYFKQQIRELQRRKSATLLLQKQIRDLKRVNKRLYRRTRLFFRRILNTKCHWRDQGCKKHKKTIERLMKLLKKMFGR